MTSQNNEQLTLELGVVASKEVDGVEMGVHKSGTPFLTGRGLSTVCGISNSTLVEWGQDAPERGARFRGGKMAELLDAWGFEGACFFAKAPFGRQPVISAYPDKVCLAFLEYYAYHAGKHCNEIARRNFRLLAGEKLREFIYEQTGYSPTESTEIAWKHFQDRLLLNPVPEGFFSVFQETNDMVLSSIREGLRVDEHTVPDISVGRFWSNNWEENNLAAKYAQRTKYPHIYPDYFPQAQGGPQPAYIYPLEALGAFRKWLQRVYLPEKFPSYLNRKVKKGAIEESRIPALLRAVEAPRLKILAASEN
jgi:hypothetical protein